MANISDLAQEKEIVELAVQEGHDADIPSNIGVIVTSPSTLSHFTTSGESAKSPRESISDKDVEKGLTSSEPVDAHEITKVVSANEDASSNEVGWDGDDDPNNPMNWPPFQKWLAVSVVSALTFLTPLGSSIFAPGVPAVMKEFHSDSTLLSGFVLSIYVLGFAFGPLGRSYWGECRAA
jgi:hypothetical protein